MMTSKLLVWCGIDVSKETFDVSIVFDQPLSDFAKVPVAKFKRDKHGVEGMNFWLADHLRGSHVDIQRVGFVMEATGNYSLELFELLQDQDWENVSIVNPRLVNDYIKSLGKRSKTDRIDARALGFFGRERTPVVHVPRKPEYQQLRDLVRYRRVLIKEKTAISLRLRTTKNKFVIKGLKRQIKSQERLIEGCEKEIKKVIKENPDLSRDAKLLRTMSGVGPVTTWTVLAELGDLRLFQKSRQLSSLAGTAPVVYESGSSVKRKTRLSKNCGKAVREVLYFAALSAVRVPNNQFAHTYERLVKAGKSKKAALCAVMRKMLVVLRAMLISNEPFNRDQDDPCGKPSEKKENKQRNLPISA